MVINVKVSLEIVDTMQIPKQEFCNVCCADGLDGGMSTVFEVLGGLSDGTERSELARCADKLKACGVSEKNAIFIRMLQWPFSRRTHIPGTRYTCRSLRFGGICT